MESVCKVVGEDVLHDLSYGGLALLQLFSVCDATLGVFAPGPAAGKGDRCC